MIDNIHMDAAILAGFLSTLVAMLKVVFSHLGKLNKSQEEKDKRDMQRGKEFTETIRYLTDQSTEAHREMTRSISDLTIAINKNNILIDDHDRMHRETADAIKTLKRAKARASSR